MWVKFVCTILPILVNFILFQTLKKSSILWWLLIDLQIEFKILIVTYSPWTGSCLQLYIKNLLHSYIPTQDLRSSKKNLLAVPAFNINSHGHHAFSVAAPLLWNSLPQHIRDAGSWDIFKRQLKTVPFRCALLILLMMWLWCFISYIIFFSLWFLNFKLWLHFLNFNCIKHLLDPRERVLYKYY